MTENEQDVQVKTAVELAEEKQANEVQELPRVVLPLNKYSKKPLFPSRLIKKQMCKIAMINKQDISPFADADCPNCHGSGVMASYTMGKERVRKVCNCIHRVLNFIG
jgi:hypothetical protein